MDEKLLAELYGVGEGEAQQEALVKEAQAELVQAVADEAGVDINSLDEDELEKFAQFVLSDESDSAFNSNDPSLEEADAMGRVMAHAYVDEQAKIASAMETGDWSGIEEVGENLMSYDHEVALGYALEKQAEAWDLTKEAADPMPKAYADRIKLTRRNDGESLRQMYRRQRDTGDGVRRRDMLRSAIGRGTGYYDIQRGRQIGKARNIFLDRLQGEKARKDFLRDMGKAKFKGQAAADLKAFRSAVVKGDLRQVDILSRKMGLDNAHKARLAQQAERGLYMRGAGKAGLALGAAGAGVYGASRLMKQSSYDPALAYIEELDGFGFAKEAELRAAEILLEHGVDPETFEACEPEHVKLASFPEVGEAETYEGDAELADYNEMLDEAAIEILEDLGLV